MVPSATWETRHCLCVHTALKAWNCPAVGWVTTTLASFSTTPPPTGTSATRTCDADAVAEVCSLLDGLAAGSDDLPPHAVSTAPAPSTPAPISTPRRVAVVCDSCRSVIVTILTRGVSWCQNHGGGRGEVQRTASYLTSASAKP